MLVLCLVVYGKGFVGAIGTYAIQGADPVFAVATAASYAFSFGLPQNQRSVVALGMSTRNIGAALAPLFAILMWTNVRLSWWRSAFDADDFRSAGGELVQPSRNKL